MRCNPSAGAGAGIIILHPGRFEGRMKLIVRELVTTGAVMAMASFITTGAVMAMASFITTGAVMAMASTSWLLDWFWGVVKTPIYFARVRKAALLKASSESSGKCLELTFATQYGSYSLHCKPAMTPWLRKAGVSSRTMPKTMPMALKAKRSTQKMAAACQL